MLTAAERAAAVARKGLYTGPSTQHHQASTAPLERAELRERGRAARVVQPNAESGAAPNRRE
jgi:hypothetical protein